MWIANKSILPFIGANNAGNLAKSQSTNSIPTNKDYTDDIKKTIREYIESNFRFTNGFKFDPKNWTGRGLEINQYTKSTATDIIEKKGSDGYNESIKEFNKIIEPLYENLKKFGYTEMRTREYEKQYRDQVEIRLFNKNDHRFDISFFMTIDTPTFFGCHRFSSERYLKSLV